MFMRLPKAGCHIRLAFVLMLALEVGCAPAGGIPRTPTTAAQPTSMSSTPAPPPTVGSFPAQCPISPPSARRVFAALSPVIGSAPVWATWPSGVPNRFHPNLPPPYPSNYVPPYGWQAGKIIWEVGPRYMGRVTVQGSDIDDHTPLAIQLGNDTPTVITYLDPEHPNHQSALGSDWAEWGSYLIIPKAGCYRLEVSWLASGTQPAGHWEITFAEGV